MGAIIDPPKPVAPREPSTVPAFVTMGSGVLAGAGGAVGSLVFVRGGRAAGATIEADELDRNLKQAAVHQIGYEANQNGTLGTPEVATELATAEQNLALADAKYSASVRSRSVKFGSAVGFGVLALAGIATTIVGVVMLNSALAGAKPTAPTLKPPPKVETPKPTEPSPVPDPPSGPAPQT